MHSHCVRSMSEVIELLLREASLADLESELERDAAARANIAFTAATAPEMLSQPAATAPPDLQ